MCVVAFTKKSVKNKKKKPQRGLLKFAFANALVGGGINEGKK